MNKAAIVTGASSGIGLALAQALVADGYRVMMADIHEARLKQVAAPLGNAVKTLAGDIAAPSVSEALAEQAFTVFGSVDLVFANAGIGMNAPLLKARPEQFDRVFDINVKGAWLTAQAVARRWVEAGANGRICITGSEHSLGYQHAYSGLYTASKHAVIGLADVWRHELPETISISVLCPGLVATQIYDARHVPGARTPSPDALAFGQQVMGRGMPPEEVARKAIDGTLAGDFIIVTHSVSRPGAETRWHEVERAFAEQAPPTGAHDKYDVETVIAELTETARLRDQ
jgi:NAD(P)-dependent dehydrogenase (short-subunit alcohol dehydrogenase family)